MSTINKIAFCGAAGTGKTTLAKWVSEEFGLPINPVGSRSVATAMGFDSPYDVDKASLDAYRSSLGANDDPKLAAKFAIKYADEWSTETCRSEFQRRLQSEKIDWEKRNTRFVSDRTPFDDLAYSAIHCPKIVNDEFVASAFRASEQYDVIFHLRLHDFWSHADDPSRVDDIQYHTIFEWMLNGIIRDYESKQVFESKVFTIKKGDLNTRKDTIRELIQEYGQDDFDALS